MSFYVLFIVFFCLYKSDIFSTGINQEYLSKKNTDAIKGIFMFLIIASHAQSYVEFNGVHDTLYTLLHDFMGQAIVAMFLFYSGYGIYESMKKKGTKEYLRTMPYKRVLITVVNFDLAVLLYCIVNICLHNSKPLKKILFALVGWKSIGNSNWYIFTIVWCYMLTGVCFAIFRKKHLMAIISLSFLIVVGYTLVLHRVFHRPWYWYCTNSCYVLGIWFSYYKERITGFLSKSENRYLFFLAMVVALAVILRPYSGNYLSVYEIWSAVFALMCVLLSMKIQFHNKLLQWMGVHTFELYIIQRIPMIVLDHFHVSDYAYLFVIISVILIFPCAWCFGKLIRYVDQKIRSVFRVC